MPMFLFAGVAYAGYVAQNQEADIDKDIQLDGKTVVDLLPLEQTLDLLEEPLTTITFLEGGSYKDIVPQLETRVSHIVQQNPWLGGWFIKDNVSKQVKLVYDESGQDVTPAFFQVVDETSTEIPLELTFPETKYHDYKRLLTHHNVLVETNTNLLNRNLPLFKISIVPDAKFPETQFALVMSMSHMCGDAYTFYRIYNMLSLQNPLERLEPKRHLDFTLASMEQMGRSETFYVQNAVKTPVFTTNRLKQTMRHKRQPQGEEDPVQSRMFFVSRDWIEEERRTTQSGNSSRVSNNSILTSWFFNTIQPTIGLMAYNFRNRLPGCDLTNQHAGNYQNPIPYTDRDYNTPQLIEQSLEDAKRVTTRHAQIPPHKWNATYSMSSNWNTFHASSPKLNLGHDGIQEVMHLPLYGQLDHVPPHLSLLCLFATSPEHTMNDENEQEEKKGEETIQQKRRLGAFVVAPASAIQKIESCGLVEEMISTFSE
mmetsp:Transcript_11540/g.17854  ORF Transcript_11540/g.17854 Transcript_11540/m.17854 type:complete len:482 (+) Transcript_11540:150-1595(+)